MVPLCSPLRDALYIGCRILRASSSKRASRVLTTGEAADLPDPIRDHRLHQPLPMPQGRSAARRFLKEM